MQEYIYYNDIQTVPLKLPDDFSYNTRKNIFYAEMHQKTQRRIIKLLEKLRPQLLSLLLKKTLLFPS